MSEISVIVPAYNVGDHLAETLDSLLAQTFRDFEAIIINDGSTDDTQAVIDRYAAADARFRSITQPNQGVSASRNTGLDAATGRFVCFLDGDDLVPPRAFELLHGRATAMDADLVIGDYEVFDELAAWHIPAMRTVLAEPVYHHLDPTLLLCFVIWNRIYRRSVIESHHLRFEPLTFAEDSVFSMSFVYASRLIATLDADVYRYRRRSRSAERSATQTITLDVERDHIAAHAAVTAAADEAFRAEAAFFSSAGRDRLEVRRRDYLSIARRREIANLVDMRYRVFWDAEDGVAEMISERVREARAGTTYADWLEVVTASPDLPVRNLPTTKSEMAAMPLVTVAVFTDLSDPDGFELTLHSLFAQRFPRLRVCVPAHAADALPEHYAGYDNLVTVDAARAQDFFATVLHTCETDFVLFTHGGFVYRSQALKHLHAALRDNYRDFVAAPVSRIPDGGEAVLLDSQRFAFAVTRGVTTFASDDAHALDTLLGNKLFRVSYLRTIGCTFSGDEAKDMLTLYRTACFLKTARRLIYTPLNDAAFAQRFVEGGRASVAEWRRRHALRRARTWLLDRIRRPNEPTVLAEGRTAPARVSRTHTAEAALLRFYRRILGWLPIRKRVFVYSIRANGHLVENAKCVYDALGDVPKSFLAHKVPHTMGFKLRAYHRLMTSKVVVTDDYVRYLRTIDLKEQQRLVQLWHAPGAFKCFGLDGGPHTATQEILTHRQYDAVLVSAQDVRPYYAHAFGIDVDQVLALGIPRTDFFFDEAAMASAREAVYLRNPVLRGKQVVLYAPTFRDHTKNRSVFDPLIDFEDLSASIAPGQVFVIRRHPLIAKPLLAGVTYPNVIEIEDTPTGDLMLVADLLVTDYSTVIFDFALLGRPFAMYCPDRADYDRAFYFEFPDDLPAPLLETHEQLRDFVRAGDFSLDTARTGTFMRSQIGACDGESTQRAVDLVTRFLEDTGGAST